MGKKATWKTLSLPGAKTVPSSKSGRIFYSAHAFILL